MKDINKIETKQDLDFEKFEDDSSLDFGIKIKKKKNKIKKMKNIDK